jgi:hypothetical protein
MSTDPSAPGGPGAAPGAAGAQPSEEELRAVYEAELSRISSADMMLQAAVSLLNIGSYRLAPSPSPGPPASPGGRDLEQVRDAIDGVRALLEILERRVPGELGPLRNALSQLQMAYAREAQAAGAEPSVAGEAPPAAGPEPASPDGAEQPSDDAQPGGEAGARGDHGSPGPGPAETSGRLWVPGR